MGILEIHTMASELRKLIGVQGEQGKSRGLKEDQGESRGVGVSNESQAESREVKGSQGGTRGFNFAILAQLRRVQYLKMK